MIASVKERPTVMLVDDTPANLALLANLLEEQYRVKVANSGIKALELASAAPPDIMLLDIMMPEMDGYEVCRKLKENLRTRDIPVIFISAKMDADDEMYGLALGAVDYLSKPVVPAILKARVSTHLALRRMHHELEQKNLILNDEKDLLEDIVTRMRSASPFDGRSIRYTQKSLEKKSGNIVLSACRPDGTQHVLVGDLHGHGLPAAFAGPLTSYIFYSLTARGYDLHHILAEVNSKLYRQLSPQLHMAASALALSPKRKQIQVWNFGLPPVLTLSGEHDMMRVRSFESPLGIIEPSDRFEPHALLEAQPAMRIYQYSDGITEAALPGQKPYGQLRLETLVARIYSENLPLEEIWKALETYCAGQAPCDDVVMVEITAAL